MNFHNDFSWQNNPIILRIKSCNTNDDPQNHLCVTTLCKLFILSTFLFSLQKNHCIFSLTDLSLQLFLNPIKFNTFYYPCTKKRAGTSYAILPLYIRIQNIKTLRCKFLSEEKLPK